MSRELRYDALRAFMWVALTGVNGGLLGWDLAAGSRHAWFSGTMAVICLLFAVFSVHDFWVEWQDERYERKYLAELDAEREARDREFEQELLGEVEK